MLRNFFWPSIYKLNQKENEHMENENVDNSQCFLKMKNHLIKSKSVIDYFNWVKVFFT